MRNKLLKGGAVTVGGAAAGLLYFREMIGSDNFDRSARFYRMAVPGYLAYKVAMVNLLCSRAFWFRGPQP